ncbi:MAG: hypothetical protein HQ591_05810 [candidate division Zixibacteria bacterium]|nr:hypothetical protein [Candidatus Tariuqbacter arcticus]
MIEDTTTLFQHPPQYIVDSKGKKVGVILDMDTFREMMEALEDLYDNRLMDEVEDEETMPLEYVLRDEDERRGL